MSENAKFQDCLIDLLGVSRGSMIHISAATRTLGFKGCPNSRKPGLTTHAAAAMLLGALIPHPVSGVETYLPVYANLLPVKDLTRLAYGTGVLTIKPETTLVAFLADLLSQAEGLARAEAAGNIKIRIALVKQPAYVKIAIKSGGNVYTSHFTSGATPCPDPDHVLVEQEVRLHEKGLLRIARSAEFD